MESSATLRELHIPTRQAWNSAVEQRRADLYAAYADARGMDLGDYRAALTGKIAGFVQGKEVRVRVRGYVLPAILGDGRLKNQFETSTSSGALDPAARRNLELALFGIPQNAAAGDRPIYGYLEGSNEAALIQYGAVVVALDDSVRERTTFTLGDTLDHTFVGQVPTMAPVPLEAPSDAAAYTDFDVFDAAGLAQIAAFGAAECQVHGGVRVDNIRRVVFTRGGSPSQAVEALLDEAEIEWTATEGENP